MKKKLPLKKKFPFHSKVSGNAARSRPDRAAYRRGGSVSATADAEPIDPNEPNAPAGGAVRQQFRKGGGAVKRQDGGPTDAERKQGTRTLKATMSAPAGIGEALSASQGRSAQKISDAVPRKSGGAVKRAEGGPTDAERAEGMSKLGRGMRHEGAKVGLAKGLGIDLVPYAKEKLETDTASRAVPRKGGGAVKRADGGMIDPMDPNDPSNAPAGSNMGGRKIRIRGPVDPSRRDPEGYLRPNVDPADTGQLATPIRNPMPGFKKGGAVKRAEGGDVPMPKPDPRYHIEDAKDLEPGIAKKWNEQMGRVRSIERGDKQPWESPGFPVKRKRGGSTK